jgi:hypothetical protein
MPQEIRPKLMKLKKEDIVTRVRGHLSVRWKDKRDVYVLTNMHTPPLDGNFRDSTALYYGYVSHETLLTSTAGPHVHVQARV